MTKRNPSNQNFVHLQKYRFHARKVEDSKHAIYDVCERVWCCLTESRPPAVRRPGPSQIKMYGFCRLFRAMTVLCFGLSVAPWVFTKVTRSLVRVWRAAGIRCMMYVDDGSGAGASLDEAQVVSYRMRTDLEQAGFVAHPDKSCWDPKQVVPLLGFVLNTIAGELSASASRVAKFHVNLEKILGSQWTTARELARLVGHILSMSIALGPAARLWTRAMYSAIDNRCSWETHIQVGGEIQRELQFWVGSFDSLHGQQLWSVSPHCFALSSDASESGWGGHVNIDGQELVAHGEWPGQDARRSSTWRELRAAYRVVQAFLSHVQGQSCLMRIDNQAAVHILQKGSRRSHLQVEALAMYELCRQSGVRLAVEWVPREENALADEYSKIVDEDDWGVGPHIFRLLDQLWGPHTVDCFASVLTARLPKFYSRWWNPHCSGVDAFTISWKGRTHGWFHPST